MLLSPCPAASPVTLSPLNNYCSMKMVSTTGDTCNYLCVKIIVKESAQKAIQKLKTSEPSTTMFAPLPSLWGGQGLPGPRRLPVYGSMVVLWEELKGSDRSEILSSCLLICFRFLGYFYLLLQMACVLTNECALISFSSLSYFSLAWATDNIRGENRLPSTLFRGWEFGGRPRVEFPLYPVRDGNPRY